MGPRQCSADPQQPTVLETKLCHSEGAPAAQRAGWEAEMVPMSIIVIPCRLIIQLVIMAHSRVVCLGGGGAAGALVQLQQCRQVSWGHVASVCLSELWQTDRCHASGSPAKIAAAQHGEGSKLQNFHVHWLYIRSLWEKMRGVTCCKDWTVCCDVRQYQKPPDKIQQMWHETAG